MLILCIGTKILPNLISPTARVTHQEVVGVALEQIRHARAQISNVLVPYLHVWSVCMILGKIYLSLLSFLGLSLLHTVHTAALASAMAESDSSDDRGPTGSGKTRGATWKYDTVHRSRKKKF